LRKACQAPRLIVPGLLAALSVSDLPHTQSPQRLLAERMITIVAHIRSQVVNFIF
jgi:hypothetical protein